MTITTSEKFKLTQTMPKNMVAREDDERVTWGRLHDCRSSVWSEIIDLHRISHEGDEVNG